MKVLLLTDDNGSLSDADLERAANVLRALVDDLGVNVRYGTLYGTL